MPLRTLTILCIFAATACGSDDQSGSKAQPPIQKSEPATKPHGQSSAEDKSKAAAKTLYDFDIAKLDGSALDMTSLRGKVVLLVNVASNCGLTPQYEGLQTLHEKYSERGFSVVGLPCNQFGGQEPGTAEQIKTFCETRFNVTFPMTEKIEVNGSRQHPLYAWLTTEATSPVGAGDISWNFEKFLIDRSGHIAARFAPKTVPQSNDITAAIEAALAAKS